MTKKTIAVISTGGTIEKTYDEYSGILANRVSVLDVMLGSLQLRGIDIVRVALMNKDSSDMNPADHALIAATCKRMADSCDGVVVVHGTDRMSTSGETTHALMSSPAAPVVFTGAMRPFEMRTTDAVQNLTEALLASQLLPPGVYVAMHNRVLQFPGILKDWQRATFVHSGERSDEVE